MLDIHVPAWVDQAACAQPGVDTALFETGGKQVIDTPPATRAYCDACPVRDECWEHSETFEKPRQYLPNTTDMVYGGLTPHARMWVRMPERAKPRQCEDCERRTMSPDVLSRDKHAAFVDCVPWDPTWRQWCRECGDKRRAACPPGCDPDATIWVELHTARCGICGERYANESYMQRIRRFVEAGRYHMPDGDKIHPGKSRSGVCCRCDKKLKAKKEADQNE